MAKKLGPFQRDDLTVGIHEAHRLLYLLHGSLNRSDDTLDDDFDWSDQQAEDAMGHECAAMTDAELAAYSEKMANGVQKAYDVLSAAAVFPARIRKKFER